MWVLVVVERRVRDEAGRVEGGGLGGWGRDIGLNPELLARTSLS